MPLFGSKVRCAECGRKVGDKAPDDFLKQLEQFGGDHWAVRCTACGKQFCTTCVIRAYDRLGLPVRDPGFVSHSDPRVDRGKKLILSCLLAAGKNQAPCPSCGKQAVAV